MNEIIAAPSMPVLDRPDLYLAAAKTLEDAGQLVIAEALLAEAERQFPDHAAVHLRRSYFVDANHSTEIALARWIDTRNLFPTVPDGYAHAARLLGDAGRFDEAEAMLAEAQLRFPQSRGIPGQFNALD
jgi:tetratricopeptide (TPR) repeat protein